MISRLFSELPIAKKIMLVVVLTMGLAIALSSLLLNYYDAHTQEAAFVENTKLISQIVAKSSTAAAAFLDTNRSQEELDALRDVEAVQYACLYNKQMDIVLAELINTDQPYSCVPYSTALELRYDNDDMMVHVPITKNSAAIGGLVLVTSSKELIERRRRLIIILALSAFASGFISLAFTNRLQQLVYRPILKLNSAARAIKEKKDWNVRAEKYSNDELGELVDTFNHMIDQLEQDQKQLEKMAYYDPLTQLPNRRLLEERLSRAIARSRRHHQHYALCFIDLDDFKWVNDTLGHDSGDALLQALADRMTSVIRAEDTLARFGGDEFVIVLEKFDNDEHAGALCDKVLAIISEPMKLGGKDYRCGASIGLTIGTPDTTSMFTLMKQADIALYEAKNSGKNKYKIFHEGMQADIPQGEGKV